MDSLKLLFSDNSTYIVITSITFLLFYVVLRLLNSSNKENNDTYHNVAGKDLISNLEVKVEELNKTIVSGNFNIIFQKKIEILY